MSTVSHDVTRRNESYRSLLQNIVSFIGLFGKRDPQMSIVSHDVTRRNESYRSLLQNIVSFIGLFGKRDL